MTYDFDHLIRQGDVTLVPVTGYKPKGKTRKAINGRVILLEGEATGHHHSLLAERAEVIEDAERIFVRIMGATTLEHQEHGSIVLDRPLYVFLPDLDYVPAELPRRVLD